MAKEKLLGDRVAETLSKIGADRVAELYSKTTKKPCNCGKRKQQLNNLDRAVRNKIRRKT